MQTSNNKTLVQRFNKEVIEEGNLQSFHELMHPAFINHTAAPGMDKGAEGVLHTFNNILRPAMPDMQVIIYEQVAEGDLVTTRKAITGTHTGPLLGVPATGKTITIQVIDIVRLREQQYYEHWGINTLNAVVAQLTQA